jgi:hypothetical protein
MCFDRVQRKLIVGDADGNIQVFCMNGVRKKSMNGQTDKERVRSRAGQQVAPGQVERAHDGEVTQIIYCAGEYA